MITSLHSFAWKDLFAYKTRFFIGTASLAVGTAFALVLIVLMNSLSLFATQKATESMGVDEVLVTPSYASGLLNITKNVKRPLDEAALAELKSLPGVTDVRVENILEYPTSLFISIFGSDFETDAALFGVADSEFDSLAQRKPKDPNAVPVLVSKDLIDIYNVGIAQTIHKPLVNEDFFNGFTLDLHLGSSSFFHDSTITNTETRKAEIVGVVSGIPVVGLTTRFSNVENMNKKLLGADYKPTFVKVYLRTAPGTDYNKLKAAITSKQFEASSFDERLGPLRSQMSYLSFILSGVIGIVFLLIALTVFYIFYTQYVEKRYILAVIKTLGATPGDIVRFFGYQALLMYVTAAIVGLGAGIGSIYLLRFILANSLGDTLRDAINSITIRSGDVAYVALLVLLLCIACIAIPTWLAHRLQPRTVLADH